MVVRIQLLGPFSVARNGESLDIPGLMPKRILARLAILDGAPIARSKLIADFWPDDSEQRARRNLNTQIHSIRKIIGGDTILTPNAVCYLDRNTVQIDITEFDALAKSGLDRTQSDAQRMQSLERADRLWQGTPLVGFDIDDWALGEVSRLNELRAQTQLAYCEILATTGHANEAIATLRELTQRRCFDEAAWMLLMRTVQQQGRTAEALLTFDNAAELMLRTLGYSPGTAMVELRESIARNEVAANAATGIQTIAAPLSTHSIPPRSTGVRPEFTRCQCWIRHDTSPMVGRQYAVDALERALFTKRSRFVLVDGESGVGKTTLMEYFASTNPEIAVLYGQCQRDPLTSYEPLAAACDELLDHLGLRNSSGQIDNAGGYLTTDMVLALRTLVGDTSWTATPGFDSTRFGDLTNGGSRRDLLESVARLLKLACRDGQPLYLVIEDIQFADLDTFQAIRHLLSSHTARHITFIATATPDFRETGVFANEFGPQIRSGITSTVEISPLDDVDSHDLVVSVIDGAASADTSGRTGSAVVALKPSTPKQIVKLGGGNPLFLVDMAHNVRQGPTGSRDLPRNVVESVKSRLAMLTAQQLKVLEIAAVLGFEFDASMVLTAFDDGQGALTTTLSELTAGRLVHSTGRRDRYRFNHGITRETVYRDIEPLRCAGLHHRMAKELSAKRSSGFPVAIGDLARHYTAAGALADHDDAVNAVLEAAAAAANSSLSQQIKELEIALGLLGEDNSIQRGTVLVELAEAYGYAGRMAENRRTSAVAAQVARARGDVELLARAALAIGGTIPAADFPDPDAVHLIDEALSAIGEQSPEVRALLLARLARVSYLTSTPHERAAWCTEAGNLIEVHGSPEAQASVAINAYWALEGAMANADQWRLTNKIEAVARQHDHRFLLAQAQKCRVHTLVDIGSFLEAESVVDAMENNSDKWGDPETECTVLRFRAMISAANGDFATSNEQIQALAEILSNTGRPDHAVVVQALHGVPVQWLTGQLAAQIPLLEFVTAQPGSDPMFWALLALAHGTVGAPAAARSALDECVNRWADEDLMLTRWVSLTMGVLAAIALDSDDHIAFFEPKFARRADEACRVGQTAFFGFPSYYLGLLARRRGDTDIAVDHQRVAATRSAHHGFWPWASIAALELHEMGATAPDHLADKAFIADRIRSAGLSPWFDRVDTLLASRASG